jgi:hypothetical protein
MDATLEFYGPVSSGIVQSITRDIVGDLRLRPDLKVAEGETKSEPGDKGEPITIGLITLALIKSSAAVALIRSIEKAFTRERRLKAKLKVGNRSIEVQAENLSSEERERIEALIREFADEANKKGQR